MRSWKEGRSSNSNKKPSPRHRHAHTPETSAVNRTKNDNMKSGSRTTTSTEFTMTSTMLSPMANADVAAGFFRIPANDISESGDMRDAFRSNIESSPVRGRSFNCEDERKPEHNPLVLFGQDLSEYNRRDQFFLCAGGVFLFTLMYGYLQELLSVTLFNRDLALFLSTAQFFTYACWSYILHVYVNRASSPYAKVINNRLESAISSNERVGVPMMAYVGIAIVRALDMGLTNSAMRYINYPAKTLVKSSRVIFTMLVGAIVSRKRYSWFEYLQVVCMVIGLVIFLHADASRAAIFQPAGVMMLVCNKLVVAHFF